MSRDIAAVIDAASRSICVARRARNADYGEGPLAQQKSVHARAIFVPTHDVPAIVDAVGSRVASPGYGDIDCTVGERDRLSLDYSRGKQEYKQTCWTYQIAHH